MDGKPIYAQNGWKYDRAVTAMMVEDMMFDPVLACKVLLGIRVPPHQELRILKMWSTRFTVDDSGFSTGKSFTYAAVSAIRSMLFAGRISGVLSGTFRQGKLIFQNYERWAYASKIFRCSLQSHQGKPRLIHGQEVHVANFRGGSEIRVLPPNLMQDAERIKSERWNDGYVDEWSIFPNYDIITSTIYGRCTWPNEFNQVCAVRGNHFHLASTPQYQHSPSYSLIQMVDQNIERGSKIYGRFTSNYRHVPRTKQWQGLVDYQAIHGMQTLNPPGMVRSEVDGVWQSDSQSFYLSKEVDDVRAIQVCHQLQRLPGNDVYLAAFDMARGSKQTRQGSRDDFAISIGKIHGGRGKLRHVLTVRKSGITARNASGIVHELHRKFQFSWLMCDPGGGGLFVMDELEKEIQSIRNKDELCYPILNYDGSNSGVLGERILVSFARGSEFVKKLYGGMQSESVLVNRMHSLFVDSIRCGNVELAHSYDWTSTKLRGNDLNSIRDYLNKATGISESTRAQMEMDLAVRQLILVDVIRDAAGSPIMDSYGMFKFKSKQKKDSAYSLAYLHFLWILYMRVLNKQATQESVGFSASVQEF